MRHITKLSAAFALACILTGCNGNGDTTQETASAEPTPVDEPQPAPQEDAWAWAKPWTWFASDEEPQPEMVVEEPAPETPQEDSWAWAKPWSWFAEETPPPPPPPTDTEFRTADSTREPFTYVQVKKEKGIADYLLPWRWFEPETTEPVVPEFESYQQAEATPQQEKGWQDSLMFWRKPEPAGPKPVTLKSVLRDMSPELVSRAERKDDAKIRMAKQLDINTRSIWDDLNEMFLTDRPSRLSMTPSP